MNRDSVFSGRDLESVHLFCPLLDRLIIHVLVHVCNWSIFIMTVYHLSWTSQLQCSALYSEFPDDVISVHKPEPLNLLQSPGAVALRLDICMQGMTIICACLKKVIFVNFDCRTTVVLLSL